MGYTETQSVDFNVQTEYWLVVNKYKVITIYNLTLQLTNNRKCNLYIVGILCYFCQFLRKLIKTSPPYIKMLYIWKEPFRKWVHGLVCNFMYTHNIFASKETRLRTHFRIAPFTNSIKVIFLVFPTSGKTTVFPSFPERPEKLQIFI